MLSFFVTNLRIYPNTLQNLQTFHFLNPAKIFVLFFASIKLSEFFDFSRIQIFPHNFIMKRHFLKKIPLKTLHDKPLSICHFLTFFSIQLLPSSLTLARNIFLAICTSLFHFQEGFLYFWVLMKAFPCVLKVWIFITVGGLFLENANNKKMSKNQGWFYWSFLCRHFPWKWNKISKNDSNQILKCF